MDVVEEHYYTINKIFLKVLGIWPHDKSRFTFLQQLLVITLVVTYIILQLSLFITTKSNMIFFIKIISYVLPYILTIMKYCSLIFNSKTIKILHYYIQKDWNIMQNKLEIDILEKRAHDCRNYIILSFQLSSLLIIIAIIVQFFPIILDFISPLDQPRLRKSLVPVEYFISQDNYFYIIVFHEFFVMSLCLTLMLVSSTQLLLLMHHALGMFKIASHRLEHSIDNYVLYMPNCERAICEKIIHVVIAHRRAMKFSNVLLSTFNAAFCFIVVVGVLSLSLNLFIFVHAITVSKNMVDMFVALVMIICHIIYIFVAHYIGQLATDYNNEIFKSVCATSWYLMPVTSQKLILFLMVRTGKDFYLTIGLLLDAKIENFVMIVNAALSYVAVMLSLQLK